MVMVENKVQPLAGRRDQQKEKAEELGSKPEQGADQIHGGVRGTWGANPSREQIRYMVGAMSLISRPRTLHTLGCITTELQSPAPALLAQARTLQPGRP